MTQHFSKWLVYLRHLETLVVVRVTRVIFSARISTHEHATFNRTGDPFFTKQTDDKAQYLVMNLKSDRVEKVCDIEKEMAIGFDVLQLYFE